MCEYSFISIQMNLHQLKSWISMESMDSMNINGIHDNHGFHGLHRYQWNPWISMGYMDIDGIQISMQSMNIHGMCSN